MKNKQSKTMAKFVVIPEEIRPDLEAMASKKGLSIHSFVKSFLHSLVDGSVKDFINLYNKKEDKS